jgi:hypothetical protein
MTIAVACLAFSFAAISVQAQWVAVAHAVAGRVQQMSDRSKDGSGFDVATVVLEANADKVYQTAIKNLSARSDLKITMQDARKRMVQFTNGPQIASLQATPLGEKITQLVIASNLGRSLTRLRWWCKAFCTSAKT